MNFRSIHIVILRHNKYIVIQNESISTQSRGKRNLQSTRVIRLHKGSGQERFVAGERSLLENFSIAPPTRDPPPNPPQPTCHHRYMGVSFVLETTAAHPSRPHPSRPRHLHTNTQMLQIYASMRLLNPYSSYKVAPSMGNQEVFRRCRKIWQC